MYDNVRLAVIALVDSAFSTAHPTVPLVYDNTPFDRNNPPDIYVEVDIRFDQATHIAIGSKAPIRDEGEVLFTMAVRENLGSKAASDMLWEIRNMLANKSYGSVEFRLPQAVPGPTIKGWFRPALTGRFVMTTAAP